MRKDLMPILEDAGLAQSEALVYLALNEIGASSIGDITKTTGLHRANTYQVLDRLIQRGLVSYILKDERKIFSVNDPQNLLHLLHEKQTALEKILPDLLLPHQLAKEKGSAAIYEGVQAFQRMLDHFLDFKAPILVYGIPRNAPELMKHFIQQYHVRRMQKKISMLHIYNFNALERIRYLNTLPYTEARFLPQEYESSVSTNICGDEVVLVLWSENPFVIHIKNKHVAESYRRYFSLLWAHAKKDTIHTKNKNAAVAYDMKTAEPFAS